MRVSYLAESRLALFLACGTKNERVFSRRDQSHWNSGIAVVVALLRFQPEAQSWIVNLRVVMPEIWSQPALDAQMIELELNLRDAPGKIAAHVAGANIEARNPMTYELRCDNHRFPPQGLMPVLSNSKGKNARKTHTIRIPKEFASSSVNRQIRERKKLNFTRYGRAGGC
jgi:hypothetical protein